MRLNEYGRYVTSIEKGIKVITGFTELEISSWQEELERSNFMRHIKNCMEQIKGIRGPMSVEQGLLLYILVRALRPEIVVETSVGNGVSSSFILKALDQNAKGELYSIDLHCREGVSVPWGKQLGWVIPPELKRRWKLVLGESTKVFA